MARSLPHEVGGLGYKGFGGIVGFVPVGADLSEDVCQTIRTPVEHGESIAVGGVGFADGCKRRMSRNPNQ